MTHSHSQIMALPIIAHNIEDELRGAKDYYDKHSRCIFCDVVLHETNTNTARLIDQNERFVTLAPYAPRFPYETWLIPKRHSSNFESILEDEVSKFGPKSSVCFVILFVHCKPLDPYIIYTDFTLIQSYQNDSIESMPNKYRITVLIFGWTILLYLQDWKGWNVSWVNVEWIISSMLS